MDRGWQNIQGAAHGRLITYSPFLRLLSELVTTVCYDLKNKSGIMESLYCLLILQSMPVVTARSMFDITAAGVSIPALHPHEPLLNYGRTAVAGNLVVLNFEKPYRLNRRGLCANGRHIETGALVNETVCYEPLPGGSNVQYSGFNFSGTYDDLLLSATH